MHLWGKGRPDYFGVGAPLECESPFFQWCPFSPLKVSGAPCTARRKTSALWALRVDHPSLRRLTCRRGLPPSAQKAHRWGLGGPPVGPPSCLMSWSAHATLLQRPSCLAAPNPTLLLGLPRSTSPGRSTWSKRSRTGIPPSQCTRRACPFWSRSYWQLHLRPIQPLLQQLLQPHVSVFQSQIRGSAK